MKLEVHEVDVSLLTFVDDLMDILIESTPSSMRLRDMANDRRLTQELGRVGCELEPSKEESLLRCVGPNARKNLAKCRTRALLGPGRFPSAIRHLGCWLEVGGGASTMIRQRIIAMRTSFYRYAGLWKSRHVSIGIRRTIFQAVINGAAISGCEPYVFSTAQWRQLESERMSLLRRAFSREAFEYTDKLRTLSDTTLRRRLGFPTLESVTRKRRLQWYQSMLSRPDHHSIYLATLFGSFDWEKTADFELNGSLTHHALPALRQLADDLTRFLPSWPGFIRGWVTMFLNHDFLDVSEYSVLREAAPSVVVPVSAEPFFENVQGSNLHQCPECKQRFSTRVGMFLHRTRVHSYRSPQIVHFKGRTCPRCKSIFATEKSANEHYRRNLKRKFCARPRGPDASHVPPRRVATSPPKNTGKGGQRLLTQQTLFGVFGFEPPGDRGQKRGLAGSSRGEGARGACGAGSKSLPKPELRKRQTSSHGSKKSDISSWFTKRAFSNQSDKGGPAATDHHRETRQTSCHCEQAVDRQTKGDAGADAHIVHDPGTTSYGDCSMRVVQDQEI